MEKGIISYMPRLESCEKGIIIMQRLGHLKDLFGHIRQWRGRMSKI